METDMGVVWVVGGAVDDFDGFWGIGAGVEGSLAGEDAVWAVGWEFTIQDFLDSFDFFFF